MFFIKSLHRCPQIPCGYCVCFYPRRTEVTILSTNQRTTHVSRTRWHPSRRLCTPTEEYCEMRTAHHASVWTPPTLVIFTPLHIEPTRTRWGKRTIIFIYIFSFGGGRLQTVSVSQLVQGGEAKRRDQTQNNQCKEFLLHLNSHSETNLQQTRNTGEPNDNPHHERGSLNP